MNLTISPQIRIVAIVGLLAVVALGASTMMLGRSHKVAVPAAGERHGSATRRRHAATPNTVTTAAHAKTRVTPPTTHAKPAATPKRTTPATTHKATTHKVTHKAVTTHKATHAKAKFRGNPVYADLPAPLQWQLSHHKVVVVSFYNPHADVDAISVAEAHAGATAAGSGFLLVNVLDNKVAGILTGLLPGGGLLPEPGVLIYKAPGTIAMRFDGFADRDSVAQAATNALTLAVAPVSAATPATTTTPAITP